MKLLIAHASAHGSTAEVATRIGDVLRDSGIDCTVAAADAVREQAHYDAYVLGSAVRSGLWLPAMASLARRLRPALGRAPFYLWLNCLRVIEPGGMDHVLENYIPNLLAGLPKPRRIGVFAGRFNPATLDGNERWLLSFHYDGAQVPAHLRGDHRDWAAIRAWAIAVGDDLRGLEAASQPGSDPSRF